MRVDRRPAVDPGHPARDRHRRLAGPRAAADHVRRRRSPTRRSSRASCAGSLLSLRESDYVHRRRAPWARPAAALLPRHMLPNALTPLIVAGDPRARDGDHRRRGPRLPGARAARPADAGVGDDAHRRPASSCATAPWLLFFPGARHRDQRDRVQPARRRHARVARPADEAMTGTLAEPTAARPGAPDVLLDVQDLVVRFRTHDGDDPRRQRRLVPARPGRAPRPRGRVGLRQERDQPRDHPAAAEARRPDRGRLRSLFDGVDLVTMRRGRRARDPRPRHRDDLPGPDDQPEPGPHGRGADGRDDPGATSKMSKADARARAIELLGMVGIPQPETRLKSFPHQFSRRHAPARDDRDGPGPRAEADDRRRAHDGPRRDDPGPGAGAHLAGSRPRPARRSILITHDLGVVAGMTDRINVMYAGFIVETATTGDLFDGAVAPVHRGPPALDAAGRRARGRAADPDRGPAAGHAQRARPAARSRRAARGGSTGAGPTTPALRAGRRRASAVVTTGPHATHRIACHNPPTPEEAVAGRPLRAGLRARAARRPASSTSSRRRGPRRWRDHGGAPRGPSRGGPTMPRSVDLDARARARRRASRPPRGRG